MREAQESDAQELADYMARLLAEAPEGIYGRETVPAVEEEREFIRRHATPETGVALVATAGERVVGLLNFRRGRRPQAAHGGAFGMSVAREHRGQGVGSAIRLYERFGFAHEGRRRGAALIDGRAIDVLLMARPSRA